MINNCICFEGIEIIKYLLFLNKYFLPKLFETCHQSSDKNIRFNSLWTIVSLLTNINGIVKDKQSNIIEFYNQVFKDSLKYILQVLILIYVLLFLT